MYIRVKRAKSTIFLHVDPSDSVLHVKRQVSKLTQQVGHTSEPRACFVTRLKVMDYMAATIHRGLSSGGPCPVPHASFVTRL